MNKVTYFRNKYNSWQRKHAKLLFFFTFSYKNIVLLTHFKDYDRNKATDPVPFWKIAIHPVYTVILGFQGLLFFFFFFFLTLSSSNPSWIPLFRVCKICKKGVWVKSWEFWPNSKIPTLSKRGNQNDYVTVAEIGVCVFAWTCHVHHKRHNKWNEQKCSVNKINIHR